MSQTYQVIGTRPIRHDGIDKVTGRAQYGADFTAATATPRNSATAANACAMACGM